MKLKRLDILGFKSFYHRTALVFDANVTAVVGPNGCGKSNIVDAIKWVMGEQGARSLRGQAMEDVIFNGSDRRGPLGLCEVVLTFENEGGESVPAAWREIPELGIERRMERGGGSDYLINRNKCRLADVQELLAGTGVGARQAYAIIEQGQIGRIVSARAEERRALIEEAAGITRYRVRKRLAERRMAETRQNMERLDDVLGEVESQLRTLRRQARKAERYQAYKAEARQIALRTAAFEHLDKATQARWLERQCAEAEGAQQDAEAALAAAQARHAVVRQQEQLADEQVREATGALQHAESEVRLAEGRLELKTREAEELGRRRLRVLDDARRASARHEQLSLELEQAQAAQKALLGSDEGGVVELEGLEEALEDARHRFEAARRAVQEARAAERAEAEAIEQAQSAEITAQEQRESAAARLGELEVEREELEVQLTDLSPVLEAAEDEVDAAEEAVIRAQSDLTAAKDRVQEAEARGAAAAQEERAVSVELTRARSRLASLQEVEARRAELGEGPRAVLQEGEALGVVGVVSEGVSSPEGLERAVSAAFAEALSAVVVTDLEAARAAVGFLDARGRGHGLFIPEKPHSGNPAEATPRIPGVKGLLLDQLIEEGPVSSAARALLRDTLLVDDLTTANRLYDDHLWTGPVVTLAGERLAPPGVLRGGPGGADTTALTRRREIKRLGDDVEALDARVDAAEAALDNARQEKVRARQHLEEARKSLHQGELDRAEARRDRERLLGERRHRLSRLERLAGEQSGVAERKARAAEEARKAAESLEQALGARANRRSRIEALEAEVYESELMREEATGQLHRARLEAATRRERLEAARERVERVKRSLEEGVAHAGRLDGEIEEIDHRQGALGEEVEHVTGALAQSREAAGAAASALAKVTEAHGEAAEALKSAEITLEAAQGVRMAAGDGLNDLKLALKTCHLELDHLAERVHGQYGVKIGEVVHEFHSARPPTPHDARRLRELEALLGKMGEVNLTAIEAAEEVGGRHQFLAEQRGDLEQALGDLEKTIGRINRTCRSLFKETFEAVNSRFSALFPRLFGGGSAELSLTDPEDMLTTGIDMLVQPPGKKVQSVNLFSGGEKAMCAIALIFAVFQVKPSPFCLLDEVDAPLDDANIGRFNEIVREMSQTSQIVLITHNKRTMEIADVLYGVTMEEPGVSKLVSVRMT
ncbi:MAG: chromosome segregation protein SMC [Bradymonadia bacterium]